MPAAPHELEGMIEQLHAHRSDAGQLADATESLWIDLSARLSPVLGAGGVRELYRRSLFLASAEHPELVAILDQPTTAGDYAPLRQVLSGLAPASAYSASSVLLRSLHDLLAKLIGKALAARLLRPAGRPSGDSATQDKQQ